MESFPQINKSINAAEICHAKAKLVKQSQTFYSYGMFTIFTWFNHQHASEVAVSHVETLLTFTI